MRFTCFRTLLALLLLIATAPGSLRAHGLGFFGSPQQAVDYAREGGGLVLIFFTGTDWNQMCHELDVKVWEDSDFAEYANSSAFALLNADYPQRTRLTQEQREELRALAARHRITHFPTLVAVTPDLLELGRHEYRGEDAATITAMLEAWSAKHQAGATSEPSGAPNEPAPAAAATPAPLTELKEGDLLPDLTFTGSDGKPLKLADLRGQAFVFTFMFTRCPLPEYCPLLATKFKAMQAALLAEPPASKNWRLLSLTIDPKNDTPEAMAKYGQLHGANPTHWQLATGELATISRLALALGADFWADKDGFITHHLRTVLVGPDGRIVTIHRDNQWQAEDMVKKLKALLE